MAVKFLVDLIETLKVVGVERCERISSRDVIEYAKKRGVLVRMEGEGRKVVGVGGRRVRYGV